MGSEFGIFDLSIGPECRSAAEQEIYIDSYYPVEIFPNDPTITGVPNTSFQAPVFMQ